MYAQKNKRWTKLLLLCAFAANTAHAQIDSKCSRYEQAYEEMAEMLNGKVPPLIKKAVFLAEWAFLDGQLDYETDFCRPLAISASYLKRMIAANHWENYQTAKQIALCNFFFFPCSGNGQRPFEYDFSNEYPNDDWHHQLVSKTIRTHKGQCHSLPWAFKLYAEEIGAEVSLAHAPRHCFVMYRDKDNLFPEDWVNVEVTAHQYQPTWAIKEHFEITDSAIIAGTYLTPISDTQTIACQLADLALGYYHKFHLYDEFTLKCAVKSLRFYPPNPTAILIRAKSLEQLLQNHLLQAGFVCDQYTNDIELQLIECQKELQATHWTQETEKLRNKWERRPEKAEKN